MATKKPIQASAQPKLEAQSIDPATVGKMFQELVSENKELKQNYILFTDIFFEEFRWIEMGVEGLQDKLFGKKEKLTKLTDRNAYLEEYKAKVDKLLENISGSMAMSGVVNSKESKFSLKHAHVDLELVDIFMEELMEIVGEWKKLKDKDAVVGSSSG